LTLTVLRRLKSRTLTVPRFTVVNVPSQRSWVNQIVPRTVAELYLPLVRNLPLPLPHSPPSTDFAPRFFFLAAAAEAVPFNGAHSDRGGSPLSVRSVIRAAGFAGFLGVACLTAKIPS
jgi:hypothetical protein